MSNTLYTLTKQINDLIPILNEKYGVKIEIDSEYCLIIPQRIKVDNYQIKYNTENKVILKQYKKKNDVDVIITNMSALVEESFVNAIQAPQIRQILIGLKEQLNEVLNMTEIYCIKWLDGLTPMFDTEPEKVLEELLEILKKLV